MAQLKADLALLDASIGSVEAQLRNAETSNRKGWYGMSASCLLLTERQLRLDPTWQGHWLQSQPCDLAGSAKVCLIHDCPSPRAFLPCSADREVQAQYDSEITALTAELASRKQQQQAEQSSGVFLHMHGQPVWPMFLTSRASCLHGSELPVCMHCL